MIVVEVAHSLRLSREAFGKFCLVTVYNLDSDIALDTLIGS
jgi:hypothetical protein